MFIKFQEYCKSLSGKMFKICEAKNSIIFELPTEKNNSKPNYQTTTEKTTTRKPDYSSQADSSSMRHIPMQIMFLISAYFSMF